MKKDMNMIVNNTNLIAYHLSKFILFVYLNYIKKDWDILNRFGKITIYPLWITYSVFIWLTCPILLPKYLFINSNFYKCINGMIDSSFRQMYSSKQYL